MKLSNSVQTSSFFFKIAANNLFRRSDNLKKSMGERLGGEFEEGIWEAVVSGIGEVS